MFQLFSDICPKTCKNFLCLCSGTWLIFQIFIVAYNNYLLVQVQTTAICNVCPPDEVNCDGEGMLSHSEPYNLHKAIIKPGYFWQMEEDRVILALLSEVDLAPGKVLPAQTERGSWLADAAHLWNKQGPICCGALSGADSLLISNGHHLVPDSKWITLSCQSRCQQGAASPLPNHFQGVCSAWKEPLRQEGCEYMQLKNNDFSFPDKILPCLEQKEQGWYLAWNKRETELMGIVLVVVEKCLSSGRCCSSCQRNSCCVFYLTGKVLTKLQKGSKKRGCDFWPKLPSQCTSSGAMQDPIHLLRRFSIALRDILKHDQTCRYSMVLFDERFSVL